MMEKRRFLPIAAIAAVALVAAACSSGGDGDRMGPEEVAFANVMAGTELPAGTYTLTGASEEFETALDEYEGPTGGYMTDDTVTIGGIVLTCVMGPCSVTVAPDGSHFTTTGTISAMADMEPAEPGPTMAQVTAAAVTQEAAMVAEAAQTTDAGLGGSAAPASGPGAYALGIEYDGGQKVTITVAGDSGATPPTEDEMFVLDADSRGLDGGILIYLTANPGHLTAGAVPVVSLSRVLP